MSQRATQRCKVTRQPHKRKKKRILQLGNTHTHSHIYTYIVLCVCDDCTKQASPSSPWWRVERKEWKKQLAGQSANRRQGAQEEDMLHLSWQQKHTVLHSGPNEANQRVDMAELEGKEKTQNGDRTGVAWGALTLHRKAKRGKDQHLFSQVCLSSYPCLALRYVCQQNFLHCSLTHCMHSGVQELNELKERLT